MASAGRRVAIITGGTRGIGRGISESLAARGFDLLVSFNSNRDAADSFAAGIRLKHPGLTCVVVAGDLSEVSARDDIFAAFDAQFADRTLGAVVHNAGQYVGVTSTNTAGLDRGKIQLGDGSLIGPGGEVDLGAAKYYQKLYGDAFVDLCERGLARMTDGGSLVGISSPGVTVSGRPVPTYAMPGMGKCVMEYSMRLFALSGAKKNANCNVVVPGVTRTEAWDRVATVHGLETDALVGGIVQKRVPMGRQALPSTIGDVVAFLCSDEGSYITGVSLPVDGGLHLN